MNAPPGDKQFWLLCRGKKLYSPDRFQVADVRNCSALGPVVTAWHTFESEAASRDWMDSENALNAARAGEPN